MRRFKHPLLIAYELGALHPTVSHYIEWCLKAVTVEPDTKAAEYVQLAEGWERHMDPDHIELGRFIVHLLLAGGNHADPT